MKKDNQVQGRNSKNGAANQSAKPRQTESVNPAPGHPQTLDEIPVKDDAMGGRILAGDLVLVEFSGTVKPGDVVLTDPQGDKTGKVRRFKGEEDGQWVFTADNPAYETIKYPVGSIRMFPVVGLTGKLRAPLAPLPDRGMPEAMYDMEDVIDKTMALLQLQGAELRRYREGAEGHNGWRDEHNGSFACGLMKMGFDAGIELRESFDRAWDEVREALYPESGATVEK